MVDNMTEEQAYQYALDIFNQTVANLSSMVNLARGNTIAEINNIQATSYDPSDTGAYDLTMYGINQIGGIHDNVIQTVGNTSNYDLNNAINNASIIQLQTEHTSIATQTVASAPIDSFGSLFSHVVTDPGQFMQQNSTGFTILGIIFAVLLGKFIFLRR